MSNYWTQFEGKSVPLKSLLQWLSDEHDHVTDDEGELLEGWDFPVVNSMALHRWAIAEAVEDEFEYNIERTSLEYGTKHLWLNNWITGEEADEELSKYIEAEEIHEADNGFRFASYVVVKRRKAGEVEYV